MKIRGAMLSLAVLIGAGCAGEDRASAELTMEQVKERGRVLLPLLLADGAAARTARGEGIASVAASLTPDAALFWPGSSPRYGFQSIEFALSQASWSNGSQFYWQPLLVRVAPGLGLIAGVMTASGPAIAGGELEFGRYLAAWRMDSMSNRLAAFAVGQLPLIPLTTPDLAVVPNPVPLPEEILQADQAFRSQLETEGTARAFRDWFAADGITFGGGGILAIGAEEISERLGTQGIPNTATMTPATWGSSSDGALAWVAGEMVISATVPSGEVNVTHWNYMLFWERQPDGEYRILTALTNPGPRPGVGNSRGPDSTGSP